jgi:hypothetical protein
MGLKAIHWSVQVSIIMCNYCKAAPTIANSHVVPRFVGAYIKKNGPSGSMLNLWTRTPQYDLFKGPYLCASCDNITFSQWENHYSQKIWPNPIAAGAAWGDVATGSFFLSIAYRYAIHFLATSPITSNAPKSIYIRDICEKALKRSGEIGRSVFIYPYVHRPITQTCVLLPGVNHLLELAVHGDHLPRGGNLPVGMLILTPKVIVLICDGDLSTSSDCTMKMPSSLAVGATFDPSTQNTDVPWFISTILNQYVGQGQGHQKGLGRWKRLTYAADRAMNSWRMCYQANLQDQALYDWQKSNCAGSKH